MAEDRTERAVHKERVEPEVKLFVLPQLLSQPQPETVAQFRPTRKFDFDIAAYEERRVKVQLDLSIGPLDGVFDGFVLGSPGLSHVEGDDVIVAEVVGEVGDGVEDDGAKEQFDWFVVEAVLEDLGVVLDVAALAGDGHTLFVCGALVAVEVQDVLG